MNFSNLSEIISEKELRKKIGGIWPKTPTSDHPAYLKAGFYPVEYPELTAYQKHNAAKAYLSGDAVIIPAEDIPLADAVGQAVEAINAERELAEEKDLSININNKEYPFALTLKAKFMYEAVKNKKDGKIRKWVVQTGEPVELTEDDLDSVHTEISNYLDEVYADYATKYEQILSAGSVSEIRTITE